MKITTTRHRSRLFAGILCLMIAACGGSTGVATPAASAPPAGAGGLASPTTTMAPSGSAVTSAPTPDATPPVESQPPDTGGGTTSGDVPDNAVFLTYQQAALGFSIQYVEGWQVTTRPDGVVIHDKDSSETLVVTKLPTDLAAYVKSTDLPALQAAAGFKQVKQDTVKVGGATYDHLAYHVLSPADPVTGKQVPSTVDRYYVPGSSQLAIVSLSTPDGVDNVDAFRQMIESFRWR